MLRNEHPYQQGDKIRTLFLGPAGTSLGTFTVTEAWTDNSRRDRRHDVHGIAYLIDQTRHTAFVLADGRDVHNYLHRATDPCR